MKLVIGNKRYSSWSLRPWLAMKHFEIPFEEILIPLDQAETAKEISIYSPSGKVPALVHGSLVVWESLAILEYLAELFPSQTWWPKSPEVRATARAVSHEMHGGFLALRQHLPHDLKKRVVLSPPPDAQKDIQRLLQIWEQCLQQHGGPFLFGQSFGIADAMFAPVTNRFVSYGIQLPSNCETYVNHIRGLKAHRLWIEQALEESLDMPRYR
jgi:glutathione S-transferase